MPLLESPSVSSFVQIEDIYIDSSTDKGSSDQTNFDFTVELPKRLSNVIGIAVPEYHAPINMTSQFTGADKIDFQLRNASVYGGNWKTLVATLPTETVVYHTPEQAPGCSMTALFQAFRLAILKDPDFGSVCDIIPVPRPDEKCQLICRTLVSPPAASWPGAGSTECKLLFGSGVNLETSAGPVLGFDVADYTMTDITIDGHLFKNTISERAINTSRFTYLDLSFDQVPEFKPILRIFYDNRVSSIKPWNHARTRYLTQPISDLRRLTCRLRLANNVVPTRDQPIYFTVRIFYLNLTHQIPYYAKNRISIR